MAKIIETKKNSENISSKKATSIHFKPCKILEADAHNERTKKLDYVREDLTHKNERGINGKIESDLKKLYKHLQNVVKEKTGKKMQAKATPIREAVAVIDKGTTWDDVAKLMNAIENKYKIKGIKFYIHKDEGHYNTKKEWQPNYHAHLIFSFIDENTGKSIKLNRQDMSDIQTMTAEILDMKRGKQSNKKHLNALQFKIQQQEQELKNKEDELIKIDEVNNITPAFLLAWFPAKILKFRKLCKKKIPYISDNNITNLLNGTILKDKNNNEFACIRKDNTGNWLNEYILTKNGLRQNEEEVKSLNVQKPYF